MSPLSVESKVHINRLALEKKTGDLVVLIWCCQTACNGNTLGGWSFKLCPSFSS
jgi:hypothetical protein